MILADLQRTLYANNGWLARTADDIEHALATAMARPIVDEKPFQGTYHGNAGLSETRGSGSSFMNNRVDPLSGTTSVRSSRIFPRRAGEAETVGLAPSLRAATRATAALLYAFLYNFVYEIYLFPQFEYFGFRNYENNRLIISAGFAAVPLAAVVLPGRIRQASDLCSWLIFVIIYTPAVITVSKSGTLHANGSEILILSLFLSQVLLSAIPRIVQLRDVSFPELRSLANPLALSGLCLLISAILILRFAGVMSLAGFDEIYIQRENASVGEAGALFGYLILWQTYAISPLLIGAAFYSNRKIYLIPPIIALLVIYMITAAKITIFIYATIFALYVLIRWGALQKPSMLMLIGIAPLTIASLIFLLMGSQLEGTLMIGVSAIIMRGIAVQGMLTNLYAEFFASNPYTYYSHLNIISKIIEYPYSGPLGTELSFYLTGHGHAGANASFWATDGIAAGGSIGVVFIGLVVGFIFVAMNAFTRRADTAFVALVMTPFVMALANVSIFTALLSGGGIFVFLLASPLYERLREQAAR